MAERSSRTFALLRVRKFQFGSESRTVSPLEGDTRQQDQMGKAMSSKKYVAELWLILRGKPAYPSRRRKPVESALPLPFHRFLAV